MLFFWLYLCDLFTHFLEDCFSGNCIIASVWMTLTWKISEKIIGSIRSCINLRAYCITYNQTSSIQCTKFQHWNVSRHSLQLSLPYPLKPGLKLRKREREIKFINLFGDRGHRGPYSPYKSCNHNLKLRKNEDDRRCSNYIWVINNFIAF